MSIARKVFFVAASFALPIIVLATLVVRNINEHIAFARLELEGTAFQRPLQALLRDIQDHQLLAHRCPPQEDRAARLRGLRAEVRRDLASLQDVQARSGARLRFTGEGLAKRGRQLATAENLKRVWERLEPAGAAKPSPESDARYDQLSGLIQVMNTHVGDMSNLILDPELDTYHLVTDTLVLLPRTQARLARVMGAGREALGRGGVSQADRMALAAQAALLESDRDQIKSHLDTALSENSNEFHGAMDSFQQSAPVAYEEYAAAAGLFADLTRRIAETGRLPVPLDSYLAAGAKAREESFRLWDAAAPELDRLLQARVGFYARRRAAALLLSGLALLLACLLATGIAASLIHPLNRISRTLTPGADLLDGSVQRLADFTQKGAQDLTSLRITCDELDSHAENMRKTAKELSRVVFGTGAKG